ncbi:MAG: iron-containing alcohol dehydrogenase [Anaerolineales bacterium]|nr:iron-containing alcohol dehydrogenase [Anaerolineales bacterium]
MKLLYDPADENFWQQIRHIPGYPHDDVIPLRKMVFESDALFRLPVFLSELDIRQDTPLLVVMDSTPMFRKKENLKSLVIQVLNQAGYEPQQLILKSDASGQVHTDMVQIETVQKHLNPDMVVLAVGSGVVTDITKHASYLYAQEGGEYLPFIVFQTANSVSAYTSSMAPVFVEGVKRTLPSRYPDMLICDLETLVDAPREMTAAGVGDLLAIFTSFPDWYLANTLGMDDNYSELPLQLMGQLSEHIMRVADGIINPNLEGMEVLAKLISLGGLAMSLSHATTPLSGYEHVISHVLDLIQETSSKPLAQHGSQCALATILVSQAYQDFLNRFQLETTTLEECFPSADEMHRLILETFSQLDPTGKVGEECWLDYEQKLKKWSEQQPIVETFLREWPRQKELLLAMVHPPQKILDILQRVGAPLRFSELTPEITERKVHFAFLNAPLIRKRLTLGDLLIFFKWDRERLWEEISRMNVL